MYNLTFSPSLSSSLLSFTQQTPAAIVSSSPPDLVLQQKLRFVVETSPDRWAYVIFWQKMFDDQSDRSYLVWVDGHFCGNKNNNSQENVHFSLPLMLSNQNIQNLFKSTS